MIKLNPDIAGRPARIAILGGSFDPPHNAHLAVVQYLLESGRYDEIWVCPAKQNPFKETQSPFVHRLEMCKLAFSEYSKKVTVRADDQNLTGYTIDLIRHLKSRFPSATFTFVAGSDLKEEIARWKESNALQTLACFEFLPRPPNPHSPFPDISSTELRQRLKRGQDVSAWIPKNVRDYIRKNRLYGS